MRRVPPDTQTGERYATQVGELWSGLAQTLARLEALAADPDRLDEEDSVDALRRLQYRLHSASEYTLGLSPPAAAEPAHSELAAALTCARDATGEVVGAIEAAGAHAVEALLHEWRGALFRVRLARLRLTGTRKPAPPANEELPALKAPLAATGLTIAGAGVFVVGATLGPWPIWVAGMMAVCLSLLLYRP
jgi:hypothetical protein